jgi:hypothetical protein
MSISIPSGATLTTWLQDGEAIASVPVEALLPADIASLVALGEKLLNSFVVEIVDPSANTVLQSEVDAEQTASAAVEDAKFPETK